MRIFVGVPVSYMLCADIVALLRSGKAHSDAACIYMVFGITLMNLLNLFWAVDYTSPLAATSRSACTS